MLSKQGTSCILLLYLLMYTHSIGFFSIPTCAFTNETDLQSLLSIKKRLTGDPFQALSSWNDSSHFCNWHGVTCGLKHQRVTVLNLSSLRLVGTLSPQIGNLTFLREINLQENSFQGLIPQEIGSLFRLQFLRLANNSFRGKIPANLTHCWSLRVINLLGNDLEGSVPKDLRPLSKLHTLCLSRNHLSGTIPPLLANLSALQILALSENSLHGTIPKELAQLANLHLLRLSSNKLSGEVPVQLYNISSLRTFCITANSLSGSFPSNLGLNLPRLELFSASVNHFFGSIPASLANASALLYVDIGENEMRGPLPPNLGSLQNLQVLRLNNNPLGTDKANNISFLIHSVTNCTDLRVLSLRGIQIEGALPNSIGNLSTKLISLWLDKNLISGTIPQGIMDLVSLQVLTMHTNMLTGSIPDSIGKLVNLYRLNLKTNNISGEIPSSMGNITGLGFIVLNQNMLEGSIPVSLGNCSSLNVLHLARNHLTGLIPEQVIGLSSLTLGFIVSQNYLTGPLPSQVGNLQSLNSLDVSNNRLSGEIPGTLGNCLMLENLWMEDNYFEGTIPSELKKLRNIEVLDLSHNNLSGKIPKFLGELRFLEVLNLSFNMFEGEVPNEGVFTNISLFSVMGNEMLCGGVKQLKLPPCPKERKKLSTRATVLIATAVALSVVLFIVSVGVILYRVKKSKQQSSPALKEDENYLKLVKLSYAQILQFTNGFSASNLVGKGRYGSVYKGIINSGDQTIAVKVLNLQEQGADKSFLTECEALRNIRHRNLVKIITSCSSLDAEGNDFKALVFEFMPNGNLESWLHPSSPEQEDRKQLNLIQRLNIAIDVAFALNYLHHHCEVPIAHCDLKPSNVLLDDDLCAHVGDFGLARFLPATKGPSNVGQSSSIGIRGTVGYVAPEYGMGGEISTEGDLYSYGILLLEMFTGRRPTDNIFTDNFNLHTHAKMALPYQVTKIVDPQIIGKEDGSSSTSQSTKSNAIEECLVSILTLGVSCSAEGPRERMDIKDALTELQRIKSRILQV